MLCLSLGLFARVCRCHACRRVWSWRSETCACQRIWCGDCGYTIPVRVFGVETFGNAVRVSRFGVETLQVLCRSCAWRGIWCWIFCKCRACQWMSYWDCQRIWCSEHFSRFVIQSLRSQCLAADVKCRVWKGFSCQRSNFENVALGNRVGVETLKTLCRWLVFDFGFCKTFPVNSLLLRLWTWYACQRIWCWDAGKAVPVNWFGVETLETLCMWADLVLRRWYVVSVSRFGVETLEKLCLSADFVLRRWVLRRWKRCACQRIGVETSKRCACQRIWCWDAGKAVRVSWFGGVETLETLCVSADLALRRWSVVSVSGFGVETLEKLCVSADLVLRRWKRCACQRIWCWDVETLCLSADLVLRRW